MGDTGEYEHSGQYATTVSKPMTLNTNACSVDPLACDRSFRARGRCRWSHVGSKFRLRTAIAGVEEDRGVRDAQLSSPVSRLWIKPAVATEC